MNEVFVKCKYKNNYYTKKYIKNKKKKICNFRYKYRIGLEIENAFCQNYKKALVLMMNPSIADPIQSDPTTNNLLSVLHNNLLDFKFITTINISPRIETYPKNIDIEKLNIFYKNQIFIENIIKSNDIQDIFIDTGNINETIFKNPIVKKQFKNQYKRIMDIFHSKNNKIHFHHLGEFVYDKKHKINFGRHPSSFKMGEVENDVRIVKKKKCYFRYELK